MPTLTRWMLKTSLVYLGIALILGVLLVARPAANLPPVIAGLNPVFFHLLMVGWVTQLIFGVVFWMFPKYSRDKPRGSESLGWATFILLNTGLILRVVGEPLLSTQAGPLGGILTGLSAILQFLAGWAFIANTWNRVKER